MSISISYGRSPFWHQGCFSRPRGPWGSYYHFFALTSCPQIHWPISFPHVAEAFPVNPKNGEIHVTDVPIEATWKAMEALLKTGKVRSIGVSNFTRARIERLLET